ncbi:MAG TPA: hypothetical protein VL588_06555 [Bdellovibrionota bacterium]|jgi:hypothetical protein|nr:hypothetical protein [Bdellovibrionota bacterium]
MNSARNREIRAFVASLLAHGAALAFGAHLGTNYPAHSASAGAEGGTPGRVEVVALTEVRAPRAATPVLTNPPFTKAIVRTSAPPAGAPSQLGAAESAAGGGQEGGAGSAGPGGTPGSGAASADTYWLGLRQAVAERLSRRPAPTLGRSPLTTRVRIRFRATGGSEAVIEAASGAETWDLTALEAVRATLADLPPPKEDREAVLPITWTPR